MNIQIDGNENPITKGDMKHMAEVMGPECLGIFLWDCHRRGVDPRVEIVKGWIEGEMMG